MSGPTLRMPAGRFARTREMIRREIERRGYNERLQSYVSVFDGDDVDASLLRLGRLGYVDPRAPRMRATRARIEERLAVNGLLYRNRDASDGLPPGEGAFGVCGFWDVTCRARQGDVDQAAAAFTHLGLIDAALTLEQCAGRPAPSDFTGAAQRSAAQRSEARV